MGGSFQYPIMPIGSNLFSLFGNLGVSFSPLLDFEIGETLPKFMESHARILFFSKGCWQGENPFQPFGN
jgi:hypothetical protein